MLPHGWHPVSACMLTEGSHMSHGSTICRPFFWGTPGSGRHLGLLLLTYPLALKIAALLVQCATPLLQPLHMGTQGMADFLWPVGFWLALLVF